MNWVATESTASRSAATAFSPESSAPTRPGRPPLAGDVREASRSPVVTREPISTSTSTTASTSRKPGEVELRSWDPCC